MADAGNANGSMVAQLLATLRDATGRPELEFASAPVPLTGGYSRPTGGHPWFVLGPVAQRMLQVGRQRTARGRRARHGSPRE